MEQQAKPIGLYVHVPFCKRKCPYCDFYSLPASRAGLAAYAGRLEQEIQWWGQALRRRADTLYVGGGTPSLLGSEALCRLVQAAKRQFGLREAEITIECNPESGKRLDFAALRKAGVNRLSLGLQSANKANRKRLGRIHTLGDVVQTVERAKQAGICNLSLDLMLGIPGQTPATLRESIAFVSALGVQHVSAYLLKLEEGTPFYAWQEELQLPGEEEQRELYLYACEGLEKAGFLQYEISNFARPGFASKHNLKYWNGDEYLGLGPAAHSFLGERRFYFERDLVSFLKNPHVVLDGAGGGLEEYVMLRLRLTAGVQREEFAARFHAELPPAFWRTAQQLEAGGFCRVDSVGVRLTREGFLVSNTVIACLLDSLS